MKQILIMALALLMHCPNSNANQSPHAVKHLQDEKIIGMDTGQPDDVMGQPGDVIGQPDDVMGQTGDVIGQPDDVMGQTGDVMGQPDDVMGQPGDVIGQPDDVMGQTGDVIGQPDDVMGQPDDTMVHPDDAMGQPDDTMVHPDDAMGQPDDMMGQPDDMMGQPDDMMGQPQDLSLDEKMMLARHFAPLAYLHPKEKYFPADVNKTVQNSVIKQRTDRGTVQITQPGDLKSADDLKKYPGSSSHYLDFGGDRNLYKGNVPVKGVVTAPLYFNIVEKEPGKYLIQYMFYYTHNGALFVDIRGRGIGYHEGDWEHLDVHVVKTENGYAIDRIHFARHGTDKGDLLPPGKVEFKDGHPVVYIAKYGHGMYPKNVRFISWDADQTGKGSIWRTWENLVYVGTPDNPTPGNGWISFKGRWGTTFNKLNTSPPSPPTQNWWRKSATRVEPIAKIPVDLSAKGGRSSSYFNLFIRSRYQEVCFQLTDKDDAPIAENMATYNIMEKHRYLRFKKDSVIFRNLSAGKHCFEVGKQIKTGDLKAYYVQVTKAMPEARQVEGLKLEVFAPEN